jgi:hypothetical protein
MSWLVGAIMVMAVSAAGQPPPVTIAVTPPPVIAACNLTELPVTVDNTANPARDVVLTIEVPTRSVVEFQLPSGEWQPRTFNRVTSSGQEQLVEFGTPVVGLPANSTMVVRFRVALPGGTDHTKATGVRVTVREAGAPPETALAAIDARLTVTRPELRIVPPVPDRISTVEPVTLNVELRNDTGADYPAVSLQFGSVTAPSNKYRQGRGVTLEVSTRPGEWQTLQLSQIYGWLGVAELGPLRRDATRNVLVRFRAGDEEPRIPLEAWLLGAGQCIAATDGFHVTVTPPAEDSSSGWIFLWVGVGALVVVFAVVSMRRYLRRQGDDQD